MEFNFVVSVISDFALGVLVMIAINLLIDVQNRTVENNKEIHQINVKIKKCPNHKENI